MANTGGLTAQAINIYNNQPVEGASAKLSGPVNESETTGSDGRFKFNDLPVFESRGGSSLCQNDPFYPSNSMDIQRGLSDGRPTAMHGTCFLGNFQPISAEQAALLTESK